MSAMRHTSFKLGSKVVQLGTMIIGGGSGGSGPWAKDDRAKVNAVNASIIK